MLVYATSCIEKGQIDDTSEYVDEIVFWSVWWEIPLLKYRAVKLPIDCNWSQSALDKYSITITWFGESYLGLTINWQYKKGFVDISMHGYVPKALANY